jgi:hypothetical protein
VLASILRHEYLVGNIAMKRSALILRLAVLCSAFLLISDVAAQFGGGGGVFGGGRSSGRSTRGGDSQGGNSTSRNERQVAPPETNSYEQIEFRLGLFEEDLKLTPAQSDAWQAFAEKVRAYAGDLARERTRAMRAQTTDAKTGYGLQHIAQAVDTTRNRMAALEAVESAAKGLYQALTPDQKSLADMRIPTIVATRPTANPNAIGSRLPDIGPPSTQSR